MTHSKDFWITTYVNRIIDFAFYTCIILDNRNNISFMIVIGFILFSLTHILEYMSFRDEKKMD